MCSVCLRAYGDFHSHTAAASAASLRNDYSEGLGLAIEANAAEVADYLERHNIPDVNDVRGDSFEARRESQRFLIKSYSQMFAQRGMTLKSLQDYAQTPAKAPSVIKRLSGEPLRFDDAFALSEIAVLAKVGQALPGATLSFSGAPLFYLSEVTHLNGPSRESPISIRNALSAHDVVLYEGLECVFFLSPTFTAHKKAAQASDDNMQFPPHLLEKAFAPYCLDADGMFSLTAVRLGKESVSRQKVLALMQRQTKP